MPQKSKPGPAKLNSIDFTSSNQNSSQQTQNEFESPCSHSKTPSKFQLVHFLSTSKSSSNTSPKSSQGTTETPKKSKAPKVRTVAHRLQRRAFAEDFQQNNVSPILPKRRKTKCSPKTESDMSLIENEYYSYVIDQDDFLDLEPKCISTCSLLSMPHSL